MTRHSDRKFVVPEQINDSIPIIKCKKKQKAVIPNMYQRQSIDLDFFSAKCYP